MYCKTLYCYMCIVNAFLRIVSQNLMCIEILIRIKSMKIYIYNIFIYLIIITSTFYTNNLNNYFTSNLNNYIQ